jgi:hypothetical protein
MPPASCIRQPAITKNGQARSFSRRDGARVLQIGNVKQQQAVARMERSAIRGTIEKLARPIPNFAALHPGYDERKK